MAVRITVPEHPDLHVLRLRQRDLQADRTFIIKRCNLQLFNPVFRNPFHPDRLPDPALGSIKHTVRFEALFASALTSAVRVVLDSYPECIVALLKIVCHIKREGKISVFMLSEKVTVPPDTAVLINRPKMQQEPLVFRDRVQVNKPKIPEIFSREKLTAHAGTDTFGRKRNQDLTIWAFRPFILFRKRIIPGTIETDPVFTAELRAWIFRQDAARVDLFTPDGRHPGNSRFFMFLWFQCRNGIK